jgi:hypothetical protein
MADLRGAPGFGQVDLDIEDEPNATPGSPAKSANPSVRSFGQVDLDLGDSAEANEPPPPPSTSRVFGPVTGAPPKTPPAKRPAKSRKPTDRTVARSFSVNDESTRIVTGEAREARDALAAATRPPPASPLHDDGNTRAWSEIDAALLSVGEDDNAPPSSRSGAQPAPSGSGVATRDGRVAAMRELYAKGDADGALALGATLGQSIAPAHGGDHPDASIVVEYGEQSVDMLDPFGGLIVMDDELASTATVAPPPVGPAQATAPPPAVIIAAPAAHLTLTERQSIPRLLKSMAEISKLKIDHRAGFLLAHVDSMQTLEEILDICAMPSAEALALISSLKEMGVIEFE